MPSTRPTVDPVLDILEEMGYDFDELDGDGYKRWQWNLKTIAS